MEGVPKKEIARRLQLDVKTVRRAVDRPTPPVRVSPPRSGSLDPWRNQISDRTSTAIGAAGSTPSGFHAANRYTATAAKPRPQPPPMHAISRLSARNCRTSRRRPDPSATRIAASRARRGARPRRYGMTGSLSYGRRARARDKVAEAAYDSRVDTERGVRAADERSRS